MSGPVWYLYHGGLPMLSSNASDDGRCMASKSCSHDVFIYYFLSPWRRRRWMPPSTSVPVPVSVCQLSARLAVAVGVGVGLPLDAPAPFDQCQCLGRCVQECLLSSHSHSSSSSPSSHLRCHCTLFYSRSLSSSQSLQRHFKIPHQ